MNYDITPDSISNVEFSSSGMEITLLEQSNMLSFIELDMGFSNCNGVSGRFVHLDYDDYPNMATEEMLAKWVKSYVQQVSPMEVKKYYADYDKRRYYTFCKLMRTAIERSYGGLQKIDNFRNLYRV